MNPSLIDWMTCPYCAGRLRLKQAVLEKNGDVLYGLVECRCFVFPIVEGILLLSLSKGYGGAEEALQPYVPLQAAAVRFLERGQLDALQSWIKVHMPLASPLMDGTAGTYLEYNSRLAARLEREVAAYLDDFGRFGVLGNPVGPQRRLLRRALRALRPLPSGRAHQLGQLAQFYPARFFSPYAHSTMMQLGRLPLSGRVLSLCCGHGMFENLLRADGRAKDVVSIDGQFLNLLITRNFVRSQGPFICHDLQLGLPFPAGTFDAVFSSTCLPEIPTQRAFVQEAIRVTSRTGWTWFDCVWNGELGGPRVSPSRFYRFAQNFFARLEDYPVFFSECAGDVRRAAFDLPGPAHTYRDDPPAWTTKAEDIAQRLKVREQAQLSALVTDPQHFEGMIARPQRSWLAPEILAVSPAFDARVREGTIELKRRAGFDRLAPTFAPKGFPGYPESVTLSRTEFASPAALLERYCTGLLSVLPTAFDRASPSLAALRGA